jgi:hypothetical protein
MGDPEPKLPQPDPDPEKFPPQPVPVPTPEPEEPNPDVIDLDLSLSRHNTRTNHIGLPLWKETGSDSLTAAVRAASVMWRVKAFLYGDKTGVPSSRSELTNSGGQTTPSALLSFVIRSRS